MTVRCKGPVTRKPKKMKTKWQERKKTFNCTDYKEQVVKGISMGLERSPVIDGVDIS